MVRLKQRYILFEVLTEEPMPSGKNFQNALRDSIHDNFGDLGAGQTTATIALKYYSAPLGVGILRVTRDHWRIVQASMTYLGRIGTADVVVRVAKISGTIRHAENAAVDLNRAALATATATR